MAGKYLNGVSDLDDEVADFVSSGIEVREKTYEDGSAGIIARAPNGSLIGVAWRGAVTDYAKKSLVRSLARLARENGYCQAFCVKDTASSDVPQVVL